MTISINKRPIELVFTNVSHNNAARQQFSTYANRNDFLTVTGCIVDNLTGRGIIGANISLKYDSRFLLSNTSISFGLFQFTLNISSFDGLKQAGAYVISLYYDGNLSNQENERFYSSKLNIFEFLTWNYMFFDSSIKADNCELKYEISIKDQDNQTIYELPFHLEIENSKTKVSFINSIYYSGVMNPRTIEVGSFNLKAELDREKYISKFNLRLSSSLSAEGYTIFNCPLYIFKNEDNEYLWSLHGLDLFKLSYYSGNQSNNLTLLSITNQKDASYSQGSSPNVFRDMLRNMYAVQTEWRYNVGFWTKIIIFALQAIAEAQYDYRITFSRVLNAIISAIVNSLYGALDKIISKKEHSTKEAWLFRIFAAALKWFFHYLKATIFVVIENLNDPFLLSTSYWSDIGIQLDDPNMDPRGSTSLFNNQLEMDDVIENYWGGTGTPVERGTGYLPADFAERFPDMVNTDVKGNIKTKIMEWLKKALNTIIEIVLEFLFIWMASVFLALERDKSIDTIWRMAANAIYHFITGAFYGISSFWKLLTGFVGEDVLGEVMNYIVMFLLVMFLVEVMIDVLLWIIAGIATGGIKGDWSWDNWERWSNTWDPWIRIFIDMLIFIIKWSLIIVIMIYWIGNTSWLSVIVSGMKNVVKELFKQLILEAVMSIFFSFIFSFIAPYIQQAIENLFSNLVI